MIILCFDSIYWMSAELSEESRRSFFVMLIDFFFLIFSLSLSELSEVIVAARRLALNLNTWYLFVLASIFVRPTTWDDLQTFNLWSDNCSTLFFTKACIRDIAVTGGVVALGPIFKFKSKLGRESDYSWEITVLSWCELSYWA